jgi:predicted O-methyltransferase YrrM
MRRPTMELFRSASAILKDGITKTAFRDVLTPNLSAFYGIGSKARVSASDVLSDLAQTHERNDQVKQILDEFSDLELELRLRYKRGTPEYPENYALEQSSSLLTYGAMRIIQPRIVLETGVANGHSTFFIINAIIRNGKGELHSTDVSDNVGALLMERERELWNLEIIKEPLRRSFRSVVERLPQIDFFLHDSNHSYSWQRFEYESVLSRMSKGSILASDDVDSSYAFIDFARRIRVHPVLLVDRRKIFGYLKL